MKPTGGAESGEGTLSAQILSFHIFIIYVLKPEYQNRVDIAQIRPSRKKIGSGFGSDHQEKTDPGPTKNPDPDPTLKKNRIQI